MSRLASTLRSWFVTDEPDAPAPPPTAGDLLRQRIEREPAFELGRYVVMGGYGTYEDEAFKRPREVLEALADMREAVTSYEGSPYFHPVKISFAAIDWLEMEYTSPSLGPVNVGIPAVLGGRWIANDIPLMIDVAATAVVDAMTPRDNKTAEQVVERLAKFARFGDALMNAMKDESGTHVTLHSPFGPADVREHDSVGSPYRIYRLPETDDFTDIPEGYEFQAWGRNVSIKRCRSMGYKGAGADAVCEEWERRRFIDRALVYFDPTPQPHPNPIRPLRRTALVAMDGRRIMTMRWPGQTTFSLPMIDGNWIDYEVAAEDFSKLLNANVRDVEHLTYGTALSESPDSPDVHVTVYSGTLESVPAPMGGLCCEIHWLNIDSPDLPIDDSMRHSLLPAIRRQLDSDKS